MIYLGDYIGHVLRELTLARVKADLEAARVAELYSKHELLKHFPIPKIRLDSFEAELRFLILEAESDIENKTAIKDIGANFKKIAFEVIERRGVSLTKRTESGLNKMIDVGVLEMEALTMSTFDLPSIATRMAPIIERALGESALDQEDISEVQAEVVQLTRDSILDELSQQPRMKVAVTSQELKEADPQSIITLSLKATEEGIEWTQITTESEEGQVTSSKLIPE